MTKIIIKKEPCDECDGTAIQSYYYNKDMKKYLKVYAHCMHDDTAESEDEIREIVTDVTKEYLAKGLV